MRVLLVAPFARGRDFGGSQRATSFAERLEARGARVEWVRVVPRDESRLHRAAGRLGRRPRLVAHHARHTPLPTDCDVAVASHSYLVPHLDSLPGGIPRVIDFQNLEWRHLLDVARCGGLARRVDGRRHARLMRRFEIAALRRADLALLATTDELAWARGQGAPRPPMLVPNVLPRAAVEAAALVRAARASVPGETEVYAYLGRLIFPPNLHALLDFLATTWPAIRAARPGARLEVVGACGARARAAIGRSPGVRVLGHVDDLIPVLSTAAAALLPFRGQAGSSLRIPFLALAGLPVVGSPDAFRDLPVGLGSVARRPEEWAQAVLAAPARPAGERAAAWELARARQDDGTPWDRLAAALGELAGMRAR